MTSFYLIVWIQIVTGFNCYKHTQSHILLFRLFLTRMGILVICRRTKTRSNYISTIVTRFKASMWFISRNELNACEWIFFYSILNNVRQLMKRKKKTPFDGLQCTMPLSNTEIRNHFVFTHFVFELRTSFTLKLVCVVVWNTHCMLYANRSDVLKIERRNEIRWRFWYLTNEGLFDTNNESLRNYFLLFFFLNHWELGIRNERQKEDFECSCHFSSDKEQVRSPLFYMRALIISQGNKQKHTIISPKRIPGTLCARYPFIFHWNGWMNKCLNWQMIQIEKQ